MQTTFENRRLSAGVLAGLGVEVLYQDDLATGHRHGTIQAVNPWQDDFRRVRSGLLPSLGTFWLLTTFRLLHQIRDLVKLVCVLFEIRIVHLSVVVSQLGHQVRTTCRIVVVRQNTSRQEIYA